MWDFRLCSAIGLALKTLPFIALRLAVLGAVALTYILAISIGAILGSLIWASQIVFSGAFTGGFIGFMLVSVGLYFARSYLFYMVKAAHISVLLAMMDGQTIPARNQITYGIDAVKKRFGVTAVLFGIDMLIRGVLRALFGTINVFSAALPVPMMQNLVRLAENVVRLSLTYVDEVILAYLIRHEDDNPWAAGQDGLVLYAQNYPRLLKNAAWLAVFLWLATTILFVFLVMMAAVALSAFSATVAAWGMVAAFVLAWAIKRAVFETVAIAALMQVYFVTTAGQSPDPAWKARLERTTEKFRKLGQSAGFGEALKHAKGEF